MIYTEHQNLLCITLLGSSWARSAGERREGPVCVLIKGRVDNLPQQSDTYYEQGHVSLPPQGSRFNITSHQNEPTCLTKAQKIRKYKCYVPLSDKKKDSINLINFFMHQKLHFCSSARQLDSQILGYTIFWRGIRESIISRLPLKSIWAKSSIRQPWNYTKIICTSSKMQN